MLVQSCRRDTPQDDEPKVDTYRLLNIQTFKPIIRELVVLTREFLADHGALDGAEVGAPKGPPLKHLFGGEIGLELGVVGKFQLREERYSFQVYDIQSGWRWSSAT